MLHTITTNELKARLTAAELAAVPASVLGIPDDSTADARAAAVEAWLQGILLNACDRVAAACNSCARNPYTAPGTYRVPASQVHTALVLARHAAISAVPGLASKLEGGSRSAEYSTAVADLQRLASCELRVDTELLDDGAQTPSGVVLMGRRAMNFHAL